MRRRAPMKRGGWVRSKRKLRMKKPMWRIPFPGRLDSRSYITKGGRVRLFGSDYQNMRLAAYKRSHGDGHIPYCECGCGRPAWWTGDPSWPDTGDFAHNEHGARKSDELDRGKWMRHECHMKSHNCAGKPIAVRKRDIKTEVA